RIRTRERRPRNRHKRSRLHRRRAQPLRQRRRLLQLRLALVRQARHRLANQLHPPLARRRAHRRQPLIAQIPRRHPFPQRLAPRFHSHPHRAATRRLQQIQHLHVAPLRRHHHLERQRTRPTQFLRQHPQPILVRREHLIHETRTPVISLPPLRQQFPRHV